MRISDWSSDVCSSDLRALHLADPALPRPARAPRNQARAGRRRPGPLPLLAPQHVRAVAAVLRALAPRGRGPARSRRPLPRGVDGAARGRSEEHTSELPYLMRNSYAVFSWKKKTNKNDEIK